MFLRLTHVTGYTYSQPVTFAPHALYLRPRESPRQRLHEFTLQITPSARCVATNDPLDNALDWAYFAPETQARQLQFRSEMMVETLDSNPFDFFLKPTAIGYPFSYDNAEAAALGPCLARVDDADTTALRRWLANLLPSLPQETVPLVTALNQVVNQGLRYNRRDEPGIQPAAATIQLGTGSCRDYAVVLIELCRLHGIAARFVSGYLYEAPLPNIANPVGPTMHAWTEVYLPGGGWRGLDSTRGIFCDDSFVPVAHAAVAESVNPIQGNFFGLPGITSTLSTHLTIHRL